MKIELPVLEMRELHLSMETLAGSPVFVKQHPAILSAERKLRGTMERFGAERKPYGATEHFGAIRKEWGWLILKRHLHRLVEVKLDQEEVATVYVLVNQAINLAHDKPVSESLHSIFSKLSLKMGQVDVGVLRQLATGSL